MGELKKRGRASVDSSLPDAPTTDIAPRVPDFTLADITQVLCDNPPDFLDVRDEQLSLALLDGVDRAMLDDMVSWLLTDGSLQADEKRTTKPVKWRYSKEDPYDYFDYYAASGCPNCGMRYELDFPYAYHLNPPTLLCLACGHRACPMHVRGESDTLVDRLETPVAKEDAPEDVEPLSVMTAAKSTAKTEQKEDRAVYVRGSRERHVFGNKGKLWWQDMYLPRPIRLRNLNRTVALSMMSTLKAPTIKEVCDVCGNDEAFYTTYQARSADEGMTIMYECTRCHHRKTFNN